MSNKRSRKIEINTEIDLKNPQDALDRVVLSLHERSMSAGNKTEAMSARMAKLSLQAQANFVIAEFERDPNFDRFDMIMATKDICCCMLVSTMLLFFEDEPIPLEAIDNIVELFARDLRNDLHSVRQEQEDKDEDES